MAERVVDAAFSDGVGTATFFLTDQYVVYDYVSDRVRDGVHPITSFPPGSATGLPPSFAAGGPNTVIDAALRGKRGFEGRVYFFAGNRYIGFTVSPPAVDPAPRLVQDAWNVPAEFSTYSAAWNGALNRDAYCYLFQGTQYGRYLWDDDKMDAGYPKPISSMIGIPAEFAAGVDAAVDGAGAFADAGYLFRDSTYLRFRWVANGEPHGDGVRPIQDGWTGLMEMLLAGKATSHALVWLATARARIAAHNAGGITPADEAVLAAAMLAHFKTTPADAATLSTVDTMLGKLETTLRDGARILRFRTAAEMTADRASASHAAYTLAGPGVAPTINVTRNFPSRPELNRVSSLIHEAVHVNDFNSATPNVHISEWYVSPALAPVLGLAPVEDMPREFATRYDLMSTADSLHNASSYATFARHVFFGRDSRENI